jgi:dihydroneopterin aldolase
MLGDCRRIFLRGLLTRHVRIGVHDFERVAAQRIIFDIDLYVPLADNTPRNDRIDEVVNYDFVRDEVIAASSRRATSTCRRRCATPCLRPCWRAPRWWPRAWPRASPTSTTTATLGRRRARGRQTLVNRPMPSHPCPGQGQQTLTLTGLRFDANLGILDQEKTAPQPIQVDAELNLGAQPLLPRDDDITMCWTTARCARSSSTNAPPSTSTCWRR